MGSKQGKASTSGGTQYPGYIQVGPEGIGEIGWATMDSSEPPKLVSKHRCDGNSLKELCNRYPDQQLLVYIHGYNVSFEDALQNVAQLKKGLGFNGPVLCVDWVSKNSLRGYLADEAVADAVVAHMKTVLSELIGLPGRVHFLAHSMGNRILLGAFHEFLLARQASEDVFGEVFLAAPDVNSDVFKQRIVSAMTLSGRRSPTGQYPSSVTIYTNKKDFALGVSAFLHKDSRAGKGMVRETAKSIDTVMCEGIPSDLLGHSYYCEPLVLGDIKEKIATGAPADKRAHLKWVSGDNVFRLPPPSKGCVQM